MRPLFTVIYCTVFLFINSNALATEYSCSPPKINNQCNSTDVDQSAETGALLPTSALNPIDLSSGNKYLRETDLYSHPAAPDLEIVRHYNSMSTNYGSLGGSWVLSYETRLILSHSPYGHHTLAQANGTQRRLKATDGYLESQAKRLIWHDHHGNKWHFNTEGWLIQIERQGNAALFITRHEHGAKQHKIDTISQNQRQLRFEYQSLGQQVLLQRIHSPSGVINYHYEAITDSGLLRLTSAFLPDQRRVYYHYESAYQQNNAWALTGKSIQLSNQETKYRVRSWVYDAQGRAIFVMAEQPHQWVRLYYPNSDQPLQTRLQSPNGLTYVDFFNRATGRIKAVRGATCWGCPPAMTRTPTSTQLADFMVEHELGNESRITRISGHFMGWPKLQLHYAQGQLTAWENALQQRTELFYQNQKAQRMRFANGDEQQVSYNAHQQVIGINYLNGQDQEKQQTQLKRPSPRHLHIHHANETEKLIFNHAAQVKQRTIERTLSTPSGAVQWHYNEDFVYDADHPKRLIKHKLPEGGALHYIWSEAPVRLRQIEWENRQGKRQLVVEQTAHGYTYNNGLQRLGAEKSLQLIDPLSKKIWWQQQLQLQSHHGLVTAKQQVLAIAPQAKPQQSHYFYNTAQQLVIEQNHQDPALFYAWDTTGALAATNHDLIPTVSRDESGLVKTWQYKAKNYILRYNAMRRLHVVHNSVDTLQKNQHNAAGYRIYAQHYPQATQQFFLYDSKKIIAEYTAPFSAKLPIHAPHPVSRRYIYFQNQPVGLIDYNTNKDGELLVMHSDHLGAVHIISDTNKTLRWAATYDTFGQATQVAGDLDFHLRREGQYYDMSTGWHDNLLRTYLPQQGHYLEPDPLGPNPTTQLLGYAKQQPLNHTDPWGLLLFSFDGTRYDQTSGGVVHLLNKAVQDSSYYVVGPGNPRNLDWDALVAYTSNATFNKQWQSLLNHLDQAEAQELATPIPIDIIGFSRGSAVGLHFANQVVKHTQNGLFSHTDSYGKLVQACIQPRFMGLLDTVAQIGILGAKNYQYDFTVSPAWQWVVHGVAMHEYRLVFPVYSIGTGANIQEVGLVGTHGDLGGGYPMIDDTGFKPLSDVALKWILWNARAQGMQFDEIGLKKHGDLAYLHDESVAIELDRKVENHAFPFNIDSDVRGTQALHPVYGNQARSQVNAFIDFNLSADEKKGSRAGKVDLPAYYRWLDQTINWSPD